jgi:hypothetical protein
MLKNIYVKYIKKLLIFTIFILAIQTLCQYVFPQIISSNTVCLILLFLIFTAISHYVILRTDVQRMEFKPDAGKTKEEQMKALMAIERKFISHYMLITTVKLLLFLALLLIYAFVNKEDMLLFSLNFLVLYLLYSVFEIIFIKKPINKIKTKK